jgi:hypothetical protein
VVAVVVEPPIVTAFDTGFSPGVFDLRGIVPVVYALFALAVGVAAGTLIRRTVAAMAATLGVYATVRLAVELWLRPHLASPRTLSYSLFGPSPRSGLGDWVVSTTTVDGAGHVLAKGESLNLSVLGPRCPGLLPSKGGLPDQAAVQACVQRIGLHVQATYQPGNRYWLFQGSRRRSSSAWPWRCSGSASGGYGGRRSDLDPIMRLERWRERRILWTSAQEQRLSICASKPTSAFGR